MLSSMFSIAKPIWAKKYIGEKNIVLFFTSSFRKGSVTLRITGNNFYRIFLNGNFVGYGPQRAAKGLYRIEEYPLQGTKEKNYLVIEVSGSLCTSFYALNSEPFVAAEIIKGDKVIASTPDGFRCSRNSSRLQKVVRFSYQRAFSESYRLNQSENDFFTRDNDAYPLEETVAIHSVHYETRDVPFASFAKAKLRHVENGHFLVDHQKDVYQDRYMFNKKLGIFETNELEIDPNKEISQLQYFKEPLGKTKIRQGQFVTYSYVRSLTGFISLSLKVNKPSRIAIVFDEIDGATKHDQPIGISFSRNTTHNIVTYDLAKGHYQLLSFEPYTAKYIRVIALQGETEIVAVGIRKYENGEKCLSFSFPDKKLQVVYEAALNTFKQNAVDLLTDCPSRERAGWLFDSYFTAKAEQFVTGNNLVEKAFLENYASSNVPNIPPSMVPMCYPADFEQDDFFIPNWAMWYVLELEDYLKRTGDRSLIEKSKMKVLNLQKYFASFENEFGMLEDLKSWVFVEWSHCNDDDHIRGVNIPSNILYGAFLSALHDLYGSVEEKKITKLKENIVAKGFDGHYFVDNLIRKNKALVSSGLYSETCQYYAFYLKTVEKTDKRFASLYQNLIKNFGPTRKEGFETSISPSAVLPGYIMRLSLLDGDVANRNLVEAESLDYFYQMAIKTGTLWEHASTFASLNHAFTSVILRILTSTLFGLESFSVQDKAVNMRSSYLIKEGLISIPLSKGHISIAVKNGKRNISIPKGYESRIVD